MNSWWIVICAAAAVCLCASAMLAQNTAVFRAVKIPIKNQLPVRPKNKN
ncbi:hypothetical protein HP1_061 [Candidatus Termititenax spirochaetophilus]|uniref:Uncharacterized protein n=1 Tax=Candidatus Termititenax spirochaetophilus TaxID=2218522 RepID=A0A388T7M7_9BACT|nr:hypothetical protein HP1_061 [Candidatus Termititenax spirochaetophilus]